MVLETNSPPVSDIEFTLEKQWTIHQAFLNYIDTALSENTPNTPNVEITILEKLEATDSAFTWFELDRTRYECNHHQKSDIAPAIDREPAKSIVNKINKLCQSDFG